MKSAGQQSGYEQFRVGESFNIFQATIAMVAIFVGFVFSGLLQILLSSEPLNAARICFLWLLTLSMVTFSLSLILFHATAHRALRYWGIFYPRSIFNLVGAWAFNLGILFMFLCVACLCWERDLRLLSILIALSGVGIVVFGCVFRQMHTGKPYLIDVDRPVAPTSR